MKFSSFYQEFIPKFRDAYGKCVTEATPVSLYDPIHFILDHPGKQIRPAFLAAVASLYNGKDNIDATPAACCVEMIHNFTLVHDDIMDNDLMRHGNKTIHVQWGVNNAILSGDGLFAIALSQLDYYSIFPDIYTRLMPVILKAVTTVCEGQAEDMDFETRQDVSLEEYLSMVEKKTSYLLSVSARAGAIISRRPVEQEMMIEKIIRELGVVFQIQDDLLELTSNSENMGKTLGSDLIKQKKTFPYLFAKQELEKKQWLDFLSKTSEEFIGEYGIEPARNVLEDNFIFDRINEVITLRHVTIKDMINKLPGDMREMLSSMIEFVMNRKK